MIDFNSIKLIVLDVDGTMTDGSIHIDNNGVETKRFDAKDGCGIVLAQSVGIEFMILTGRESNCVSQRAKELHIEHVFQGIHQKAEYLQEFAKSRQLTSAQIAYIGDDLNDLPAMHYTGVSACPADAAEEVKAYCNIVLSRKGGEGAVREFTEMLLKERNLWDVAIKNLFPGLSFFTDQ